MHKNDKIYLRIFIISIILSLDLSIIYNLNYIFWIISSVILFLIGSKLFESQEKYEEYDPLYCDPEKFYRKSKDKKSKTGYLTRAEIVYLQHR